MVMSNYFSLVQEKTPTFVGVFELFKIIMDYTVSRSPIITFP